MRLNYDDVMIREHFLYYWPSLKEGNCEFPLKGPVMWSIDVFFVVSPNKLLKM